MDEKLYGVKNYGTLEPEYVSDKFSPITVKGSKYVLVNGLKARLNENQSLLNELKREQKALAKVGKDLAEEDAKRMKRLQERIANLNRIINEQVKEFHLNIK